MKAYLRPALYVGSEYASETKLRRKVEANRAKRLSVPAGQRNRADPYVRGYRHGKLGMRGLDRRMTGEDLALYRLGWTEGNLELDAK